jgi:hypothetical protein
MTVIPVVDYEPRVVAAGPIRSRPNPAAHRRKVGHGRPVAAPGAPAPPSERLRRAAAYAETALRAVLEVIDRRRPTAQLRLMLAGGLVDSVESFARSAPPGQSGAVLRRVRLQATGPDERAFEVSASYSRGPRVHAVACRIELADAATGGSWQVVALHIG